jgi:hypothetical protein
VLAAPVPTWDFGQLTSGNLQDSHHARDGIIASGAAKNAAHHGVSRYTSPRPTPLGSKRVNVNVVSFTYHESGLRTVAVHCSACNDTHEVVWPKDTIELCGELPCGVVLRGLRIPAFCFDPRHHTGFRKYPPRAGGNSEHSVVATESADSINDNAIGEYENSWTE